MNGGRELLIDVGGMSAIPAPHQPVRLHLFVPGIFPGQVREVPEDFGNPFAWSADSQEFGRAAQNTAELSPYHGLHGIAAAFDGGVLVRIAEVPFRTFVGVGLDEEPPASPVKAVGKNEFLPALPRFNVGEHGLPLLLQVSDLLVERRDADV